MIRPAEHLANIQEYFFSKKLREVNERIAQGKPVINLGIGSPDLPPPPGVTDALTASLQAPSAHMYQSYQGLPELREAMAGFYRKYFDVNLQPKNEILPLMGSKEGIFHISKAFLNPGDKVLLPNPGYPTYTSVTHLNHAKPVYYNLKAENKWLPDFEAIEKTNLTGVKLMWISYPHMPTGAKATKENLAACVRFAQKHQILLVNDNPYSFILNDKYVSVFQVEGAKENCLELNSLSKTFNMAGWRVGMVIGSETLLQDVLKVKSNLDSGMFYGLQKGAVAALKTPNLWLKAQNKTYEQRRKIVWQIARQLGCTFDKQSAGLFVWAKHPEHRNTLEMVDNLLDNYYVFVAPGTIFGDNGNGYIRFSLCVKEQLLEEVLERVKSFAL